MSEDYIDVRDDYQFISVDCTVDKCSFQVRAEPINAVCMCGALVGQSIENYIKLSNKAKYPLQVSLEPLTRAIKTAFENSGFDVEIDISPK